MSKKLTLEQLQSRLSEIESRYSHRSLWIRYTGLMNKRKKEEWWRVTGNVHPTDRSLWKRYTGLINKRKEEEQINES